MIKAIIFDLGGIIYKIRFLDFYQNFLGVNENQIEETKKFEHKLRRRLNVSKITLNEYFEKIAKKFSLSCDVNTYIKNLMNYVYWNRALFSFLKDKLSKKYELFIFSNNSGLFINDEKKKFFSQVFKKQFYSYEMKIRKPEIEAYQYVLTEINCKPNECLFIDNKENNLIPAKELGMKVILFQNLSQLKRELIKIKAYF